MNFDKTIQKPGVTQEEVNQVKIKVSEIGFSPAFKWKMGNMNITALFAKPKKLKRGFHFHEDSWRKARYCKRKIRRISHDT